jgi:phosphoglycolate phosphatase
VRFELIVFDLDGTLVDSREDIAVALNGALREQGLPVHDLAAVTRMIGGGVNLLVDRALLPDQRSRAADVVRAFRRHYADALVVHTRAYPGIEPLLASSRARLAVATNKPAPLARGVLEQLGLMRHFVRVVGEGEGLPRKPDPACVLDVLASTGVDASRAAYVGDSDIDVATARAAGTYSIAVTWGYTPRDALIARAPDAICDHVDELAALLGQ